jgi:hypothetical protein
MGILDDLSMGLGLKDRDEDYYERTAQTLGRTQGAGREATYRQSRAFKGKPKRAGLLSGFGGGSDRSPSDREQSRGLLPTLLGYRDMQDMFDRGGRYASGGMYQGAGGYSMLANLAHALSGQEFGERKPYEVDIKNPTGTSTGRGSSPRPQLRPETNPYAVGGGFDVTAPPAMTNPYAVGGGFEQTAPAAPSAMPAPTTQSIQTTAGAPSMGMTLEEYIMSQGVPVNEMTKEQYLPSYLQGYGISY